jgi:hypothetical protein
MKNMKAMYRKYTILARNISLDLTLRALPEPLAAIRNPAGVHRLRPI